MTFIIRKSGAKSGMPVQTKLLEKSARARRRHAEERSIASAVDMPGRNDLVPGIEIEWRSVDELVPARRRVRKNLDTQVEKAVRSIRRFGFVSPVIVRGGEIVDGHIRLRAVQELALEQIPCIDVSHLSPEDTRMLRLTLNRLAETGEWDLEELRFELCELKLEGLDLEMSGFTLPELDIIMRDAEARPEPDIEDLMPDVPVARPGDLWLLGEHRLHCGDALSESSYEALMEGKLATAVLTDPPYNVRIANNVSGNGKKKHNEFRMASGEMSREEFSAFLGQVHANLSANLMAGGVAFVFIDWRSVNIVMDAGEDAGLKHINTAVWYKGNGGGMGAFLRSAHEFVAIFCKGERPAINNVKLGRNGRDRTNVWEFPGANRPGTSAGKALKDHPTPKNVDMCIEALLDVTHDGDTVLDPFLGSGTTLIAAERCGRVCHGIELEPLFVDVCIRRWEEETGQRAVHAETGLSYAETLAIMEEAAETGDDGEDA